MVMHRVIRTLITTATYRPIADRVVAVLLVGDGDQVPHDNVTRFGTAGAGARGVGLALRGTSHSSAAKLPATLKPKVLEVCNAHDIVCGWTNADLACLKRSPKLCAAGIYVHLHYVNHDALLAAAARAVSRLGTHVAAPSTNRPAVGIPRVPQARWSEPMGDDGMIIPAADGSVITTKCTYHSITDADVPYVVQKLAPGGALDWRRGSDNSGCFGNIRDAAGNDYYFMTDNAGAHIRSVNADGWVRWTTPALPDSIDRVPYATPALGANGDVYFLAYNGFGHGYLLGAAEGTGALTVVKNLGFPLAIYAYSAGLVVADGSGAVSYFRYDGSTRATYNVPGIDFTGASFAGGSAGTIFASGTSGTSSCGGVTSFSVAKVTPSGVAWTWTDPNSSSCSARGYAAATPDGGVVTTEWAGSGSSTGYVESLTRNGVQRWRMPLAATADGQLLFAAVPMVDNHGIVVIPRYTEYSCVRTPGSTCVGLRILCASQASSAISLPAINATNETSTGSFPWGWNMAIANNRVYVTAIPYLDNTTYPTSGDALISLSAPGLGQDYRLSLQNG